MMTDAEFEKTLGEIKASLAKISNLLWEKQMGEIRANLAMVSKALGLPLAEEHSTTATPQKVGIVDTFPQNIEKKKISTQGLEVIVNEPSSPEGSLQSEEKNQDVKVLIGKEKNQDVKVEGGHDTKLMHRKQPASNQISQEAEHISTFQLQKHRQIQLQQQEQLHQHGLLVEQQISHSRQTLSEQEVLGNLQQHIQFPSRPPDPLLEQPIHTNLGQKPVPGHPIVSLELLSWGEQGRIPLNQNLTQPPRVGSVVVTTHGTSAIVKTTKQSWRRKQGRWQHRAKPHRRGDQHLIRHGPRACLRRQSRPKQRRPQVQPLIQKIRQTITIPVMARTRIDEIQIPEAISYVDNPETLTVTNKDDHNNKHNFLVTFICDDHNPSETFCHVREDAAMMHVKGEVSTSNIVEDVRNSGDDAVFAFAKKNQVLHDLVMQKKQRGCFLVGAFTAEGLMTLADATLMIQWRYDGEKRPAILAEEDRVESFVDGEEKTITRVAKNIKSVNKNYFGAYISFGIYKEMIRHKVVLGILSRLAGPAGASMEVAVEAGEETAAMTSRIAGDNNFLVNEIFSAESPPNGSIEVFQDLVEEFVNAKLTSHHGMNMLVGEWRGYCLLYEVMFGFVLFAGDTWLKHGDANVIFYVQLLIRWIGQYEDDATRLRRDMFLAQFINFNLEDKVVLKTDGIDMEQEEEDDREPKGTGGGSHAWT